LLTPLPVAVATLAALSIGTLFAALNVAYRDVGVVVPFLMRVWMFATPAIYVETTEMSPHSSIFLRALVVINPVNAAVEFFRAAMLGKVLPWHALGVAAAIVAGCCVAAYLLFRQLEDSFADVI
jgi:lipopolysaccharide transport system permease protein